MYAIMMFAKVHHLTVRRYLLCLQLLSGWCFIQIAVTGADFRTECIYNPPTPLGFNIKCDKSDIIEVVSIYYDHRQTYIGCTRSSAINTCNTLFTPGHEFLKLYQCLQNKPGCYIRVGPLPVTDCDTSTPLTFMLMAYSCVPEKDFIDLCGDVDVNISSTVKHLAYFGKKRDDRVQYCTCSIQGLHTLTAVDAGIPTSTTECKSVNQWIKAVHTDTSETNTNVSHANESLINVEFNGLQSSYIRLIRYCKFLNHPVWFKIKPANGDTVRIQCGKYVDTSTKDGEQNTLPLTGKNTKGQMNIITTLADTSTEEDKQNTLPPTEENRKVPVIVGSVVGGIVLIIILIVIFVLVYRRTRREQSASGLETSNVAVNTTYNYDEVSAHQTYKNNAFEEGTPYYSSIEETKTINDNNDRFMSAESLTDYDQLKPATVFQTCPYQNKKATCEQHNDVNLYDHPKQQTNGGHNILTGNEFKDSTYDVLESKANLNSSFDRVEPLDDGTYNHIGDNHKQFINTRAQLMPKTKNKNATKSGPEYATINRHRAEQEQTGSAAGGDNTAKLDFPGKGY